MKKFFAAAALLLSAPVSAQLLSTPQFSVNEPNGNTFRSALEANSPLGIRPTEAERRARLDRAIALREEARVLQARDGGSLSKASIAYLRRKARRILGYY